MDWKIALLLLIGILVLVNVSFAGACPSNSYGNGTTTLAYYSSALCMACWQQKPIIEEFVVSHPDYRIDEYDTLACQTPARATPAFATEGKISYGLHSAEDLLSL